MRSCVGVVLLVPLLFRFFWIIALILLLTLKRFIMNLLFSSQMARKIFVCCRVGVICAFILRLPLPRSRCGWQSFAFCTVFKIELMFILSSCFSLVFLISSRVIVACQAWGKTTANMSWVCWSLLERSLLFTTILIKILLSKRPTLFSMYSLSTFVMEWDFVTTNVLISGVKGVMLCI
jgi:hypothetical protein